MGRKVVITDPAGENLRDIVEYVVRDDPDAALALGGDLLDAAMSLAEFPLRGAVHRARPPVRKLSHRGCKIYYHVPVDGDVVEILHFWHPARRDPPLDP